MNTKKYVKMNTKKVNEKEESVQKNVRKLQEYSEVCEKSVCINKEHRRNNTGTLGVESQ
jgi:succinate dehydrogenase/fumarate reductase flavoprotein subunit